MPTETTQTKTTTEGTRKPADFFGDMWGATLNMQRQWLDLWTRPLGTTLTPDQMWHEWHKFNSELLDVNRETNELTHGFVNDQVKIGKVFADKAVDMTRDMDLREPKDTAPKLAHEWFDTTRRSAKRTMAFGNDALKTFEDFGLKFSETMTQTPTAKK